MKRTKPFTKDIREAPRHTCSAEIAANMAAMERFHNEKIDATGGEVSVEELLQYRILFEKMLRATIDTVEPSPETLNQLMSLMMPPLLAGIYTATNERHLPDMLMYIYDAVIDKIAADTVATDSDTHEEIN